MVEWNHVADVSHSFTGTAHHIRLDENVEVRQMFDDTKVKVATADFIISATRLLGTPETYAFPATANGEIDSWGEVISAGDGLVSQKGTNDWEMVADALVDAVEAEGIQA